MREPGTTRSPPATTPPWWEGDPSERFWLETTDREDIGTDLNSPQTAEKGKPTPGYFLMTAVRPGDVVFHYRRSQGAIVAWS